MKPLRALALLGVAVIAGLALGRIGPFAPPSQWPFQNVLGTYDRGTLQRGFHVYTEVCAACHSLNMVAFHDLAASGGPGFSNDEVKAIAAGYRIPAEPDERGETVDDHGTRLTRPGIPADHFPSPFGNEQAARLENGGALPPDLSLIVKARPGGPDYVYGVLTGFGQTPPAGFKLPEGRYYNPHVPGGIIAMPPPLVAGMVRFADGTPATLDNEARAVTTFLAWAAEPELETRHRLGFEVLAFLGLLAGLLFFTYRKVWREKSPPAVPVVTADAAAEDSTVSE